MIGIFGGAFDPPHNGHVALVGAAERELGLDRVVIVVVAAPGHKDVELPAQKRLELARVAFPGREVVLDDHARTIDAVRAHPEWEGAVLLVGADELADFPEWKQPNELLRLVWLGVATRPGNPRRRLDAALGRLDSPGRVRFFDLEPIPIASRELRERLDRGEDAHGSIPPAVWAVIAREGLYGLPPSYTPSA